MATINALIDDDIKAQSDEALRLLNISQIPAITVFYQYISTTGKLPFIITQYVTTPEGIKVKKLNQFIEASTILNTIKIGIEGCSGLDGTIAKKEYRKLKNIHIKARNEMSIIGYTSELMALADALKKSISELVDFKQFGCGYQTMKVTEDECSKFCTTIEYFDSLMAPLPGEGREENTHENYILTLDREVRELEKLHKQSMKDPTLTM